MQGYIGKPSFSMIDLENGGESSFRGRKRVEPVKVEADRSGSRQLSSTRNSSSFNMISGFEQDGSLFRSLKGCKQSVKSAKKDSGSIISASIPSEYTRKSKEGYLGAKPPTPYKKVAAKKNYES